LGEKCHHVAQNLQKNNKIFFKNLPKNTKKIKTKYVFFAKFWIFCLFWKFLGFLEKILTLAGASTPERRTGGSALALWPRLHSHAGTASRQPASFREILRPKIFLNF
jgi:hypothetical protein